MNQNNSKFTRLYQAWQKLSPGPKAEMRRITEPDELLDLPAFYRLVEPLGWRADLPSWEKRGWQRLVFIMHHVSDAGENSLGKALALNDKINEKRLFQIIRSDYPNDIVQLRRLLKQAEPKLDWEKTARQVWSWDKYRKRNLMEDFVLNQKSK